MKYIIFSLFLYSCAPDSLIFYGPDECEDAGAQRCYDDNIQTCFGDHWGDILDCSLIEARTCCEVDGGITCC